MFQRTSEKEENTDQATETLKEKFFAAITDQDINTIRTMLISNPELINADAYAESVTSRHEVSLWGIMSQCSNH